MISTRSFSSRARLRRRVVSGEPPSDTTRRFLYLLNQVGVTCKWDTEALLGGIEDASVG